MKTRPGSPSHSTSDTRVFSNSARREALHFEAPLKNNMISFKVLIDNNDIESFLCQHASDFRDEETLSEMSELLSGYIQMEGDDGNAEIAATISDGCLLVRVCDYSYAFLCPIPIGESASISAAAEEIRKYAIKEELPLTFIDVYEEDISEVSEPFRFAGVHPMDDVGEVFAVVPETEACRLEELPTVRGEKIILNAISEDDTAVYARLCRDSMVNKLYGNDYKEDFGDAPDTAFFGQMSFEVESGISMTFAIRYAGDFAGEAAIFGFDFIGGAKVAIRMLPEFWGKGLGSETLRLILDVARDIDLKRVSTAIKKENTASIAMTRKYMNYVGDENDTALFELKFN